MVVDPYTNEYLPLPHGIQSDNASLPVVLRYVPGGHLYIYKYVGVSDAFGSGLCVGAEGGAQSSTCIA